jgi:hypothetical protein
MSQISELIQFLHDNNPKGLQASSDKYFTPGLNLQQIKDKAEALGMGSKDEASYLLMMVSVIPYIKDVDNYTGGFEILTKKGTENDVVPVTYIVPPARTKSTLPYTGNFSFLNMLTGANNNNQEQAAAGNTPSITDYISSITTGLASLGGAAAQIISAANGNPSNPQNINGGYYGSGNVPIIIPGMPQQEVAASSDKKTSTIIIIGVALLILVILIIVLALIFRKK